MSASSQPQVATTSLQHPPPRRRPPVREILMELQGVHKDPLFQHCSQLLRSYRNRYAPLVRIMLAGCPVPFVPEGQDEEGTNSTENNSREEEGRQKRPFQSSNQNGNTVPAATDVTHTPSSATTTHTNIISHDVTTAHNNQHSSHHAKDHHISNPIFTALRRQQEFSYADQERCLVLAHALSKMKTEGQEEVEEEVSETQHSNIVATKTEEPPPPPVVPAPSDSTPTFGKALFDPSLFDSMDTPSPPSLLEPAPPPTSTTSSSAYLPAASMLLSDPIPSTTVGAKPRLLKAISEDADSDQKNKDDLYSLVSALVVEKSLITCPLLHAHDDRDEDLKLPDRSVGALWIHHFFATEFLSLVVWKNLTQQQTEAEERSTLTKMNGAGSTTATTATTVNVSPISNATLPLWEAWPLRMIHQINESNRTAWLIVVDINTGHAVVVDPPLFSTPQELKRTVLHLITSSLGSGDGTTNMAGKVQVTAMVLSHIYVNQVTGHLQFHEVFPEAEVYWGGSRQENCLLTLAQYHPTLHQKMITCEEDRERLVAVHRLGPSSDFVLAVLRAATTTTDGVVTELWYLPTQSPVMVSIGSSMALDALPQPSVFTIHPTPILTSEAAAVVAPPPTQHQWAPIALDSIRWFYKRYISPPSVVSSSSSFSTGLFGGALFLPSLGGYNLVTHQLDLHWAMFGYDWKKFTHVKAKFEKIFPCEKQAPKKMPPQSNKKKGPPVKHQRSGDTVLPTSVSVTADSDVVVPSVPASVAAATSATPAAELERFEAYQATVPPLPVPSLFWGIRCLNLQALRDIVLSTTNNKLNPKGTNTGLLRWLEEAVPAREKAPYSPPPWTLDDAIADGTLMDLRSVPAYTHRHVRGSLNIPMTFPSDAFGAKKADLWLLCLIPSIGQRVVFLCQEEAHVPLVQLRALRMGLNCVTVIPQKLFPWKHVAVNEAHPPAVVSSAPSSPLKKPTAATNAVTEVTTWRRVGANQQSLHVLDYSNNSDDVCTTLVLDVRTHYEYRNGSHRHSLHYPLADLCVVVPSCQTVAELLRFLHRAAVKAEVPNLPPQPTAIQRLVLYCAAGYRSHIAVSMIKALTDKERRNTTKAAAAATTPTTLDVVDVEGGALRIMMYRPDVWTVKDRSIICIS